MISMLIYSCKQDEIELLQEISKDTVAYLYDERIELTIISSSEEMETREINDVNIAFIDITAHSGLQIAKEVRKHYGRAEIIIISDNTISPVTYLIPDIRAVSLLLKPLQYKDIQNGIKGLFRMLKWNMEDTGKFFSFEDCKEWIRVPYSQILYFEARNRKVYMRLRGKEYGMYNTMEVLEEQLPDNFRRCHRGYIVNIAYIDEIWYSRNFIVLKNNIEIPLSRSYKTAFKEVVKNGKAY